MLGVGVGVGQYEILGNWTWLSGRRKGMDLTGAVKGQGRDNCAQAVLCSASSIEITISIVLIIYYKLSYNLQHFTPIIL